MRHKSCKKLILFVYRLNMRTYSFEGGGYVFELYAIEDVMLPIHVFLGGFSLFFELVPVVETQLVIIWGQGSPMVL